MITHILVLFLSFKMRPFQVYLHFYMLMTYRCIKQRKYIGHHDVRAHTHYYNSTQQFPWLGLSFAIYGKGVFSLIADYSLIKLCFKILFREMIYHIVINVLKAFCFWGVVTL